MARKTIGANILRKIMHPGRRSKIKGRTVGKDYFEKLITHVRQGFQEQDNPLSLELETGNVKKDSSY